MTTNKASMPLFSLIEFELAQADKDGRLPAEKET